MGFRVSLFGVFQVQGFGYGVSGQDFRFRVGFSGSWFRVLGSGFQVSRWRFGVLGFRGSGFRFRFRCGGFGVQGFSRFGVSRLRGFGFGVSRLRGFRFRVSWFRVSLWQFGVSHLGFTVFRVSGAGVRGSKFFGVLGLGLGMGVRGF